MPYLEYLLWVGLNPKMLQEAAGNLSPPPLSVPMANGTHLVATRPASPPDELPVVLD
jgi:hypothetical protein